MSGYINPMIQVTRKRLLLAMYIDFLLFEAIYRPLVWAGFFTGFLDSSYGKIGLFLLTEAVVQFMKVVTPGQRALGIYTVKNWGKDAVKVVDQERLDRERWWTILGAVLLILEGSKNLVRWTQGLPAPPVFGVFETEWLPFLAISIVGSANIAAGILILRTRPLGSLIGIAVLVIEMVAIFVNKALFSEWAAKAFTLRREMQGRTLRDGELEFIQNFMTIGAPAAMAVGIIFLILIWRFHKSRA